MPASSELQASLAWHTHKLFIKLCARESCPTKSAHAYASLLLGLHADLLLLLRLLLLLLLLLQVC
jgi:hypothetical protein